MGAIACRGGCREGGPLHVGEGGRGPLHVGEGGHCM